MMPMTLLQSWALLALLMFLVVLAIRLFAGPRTTEDEPAQPGIDIEIENGVARQPRDDDAVPAPTDHISRDRIYDWAVHGL